MSSLEQHLAEIETILIQMDQEGHHHEDIRVSAAISDIEWGVKKTRTAHEESVRNNL